MKNINKNKPMHFREDCKIVTFNKHVKHVVSPQILWF